VSYSFDKEREIFPKWSMSKKDGKKWYRYHNMHFVKKEE
jgi:hypothetical protein